MEGIIVKNISNDYVVLCKNGEYTCKPRGKFRNDKITPLVGDTVVIDPDNKYILDIKPRKNMLIRPSVANIDQALIVTSVKEPDFSTNLLDKLLVVITYNNIEPIICLTKLDLLNDSELKETKKYIKYYESIGYKVILNTDKKELKEILKNKLTVITGQSGAGKSTLLNTLDKNLELKTNEISKALGRGKHTTRHVELYHIYDGLVVDTPGFSAIDLSDIPNIGISDNMKEMYDVILQKYDRFIRSDDDAEFSPNFLEYMDKCLEYFQDDEKILCVTGYSYPVQWDVSEGSTVLKENFICPMWGTGFWTKKYLMARQDIRNNELYKDFSVYIQGNYMKKGIIGKMTDAAICDYLHGGLVLNKEESIMHSTTDVALRVYLMLKNKYAIMPVESKVRNCGFDGTGTYCQDTAKKFDSKQASTYNYSFQKIDTKDTFNISLNLKNNLSINKQKLNEFDKRKRSTLFLWRLKVFLFKILGETRYKKVLEFVREKRGK